MSGIVWWSVGLWVACLEGGLACVHGRARLACMRMHTPSCLADAPTCIWKKRISVRMRAHIYVCVHAVCCAAGVLCDLSCVMQRASLAMPLLATIGKSWHGV